MMQMDEVRRSLSAALEEAKARLAQAQDDVKKLGVALDALGGPVIVGKKKAPVSTNPNTQLPRIGLDWVRALIVRDRMSFDEIAQEGIRVVGVALDDGDMRSIRQRIANTLVSLHSKGEVHFDGKKGERRYWRSRTAINPTVVFPIAQEASKELDR